MKCCKTVSVFSDAVHLKGSMATIAALIGRIGWLLLLKVCRGLKKLLFWCGRQLSRFRPFNPLWGVIVSLIGIECFTIGIGIVAEVSIALTVYSIFHTVLICGVIALLIWIESASERRRSHPRRSIVSTLRVVAKNRSKRLFG